MSTLPIAVSTSDQSAADTTSAKKPGRERKAPSPRKGAKGSSAASTEESPAAGKNGAGPGSESEQLKSSEPEGDGGDIADVLHFPPITASNGSVVTLVKGLVDNFTNQNENPKISPMRTELVATVVGKLEDATNDEIDTCGHLLIDAGACNKKEWDNSVKALKSRLASMKSGSRHLDFVRAYIKKSGFSLRANGDVINNRSFDPDPQEVAVKVKLDDLVNGMLLANIDYDLGLNATGIKLAVDAYLRELKQASLADAYARTKFRVESLEAAGRMWNTLEQTVFEVQDGEAGFAAAVIKKFMHQIKRKMLGLPVFNHLVMIITGQQQSGKSTFCEMLYKPVSELAGISSFAEISCEKSLKLWENYVLHIDEKSNESSIRLDTIKSRVTAPVVAGRKLGTNNQGRFNNNATIIITLNASVANVLVDNTGMRRFLELMWKVLGGANDPAFDVINSTDFGLLWQSVDEHGPDPLAPFDNLLKQKQEELRSISPVEEWILTLSDPDNIERLTWTTPKQVSKLYIDNFLPWLNTNHNGVRLPSKAFALMLAQLAQQRQDLGIVRQGYGKKPVLYHLKGLVGRGSAVEPNAPADDDAIAESA